MRRKKRCACRADHWFRNGALKDIEVEFDLAAPAFFGVAVFVPALMKYIEKYRAKLVFNSTLQSPRFPSIFLLGDVCSAPNAKTVAAVRKQAVVVAENLLACRDGHPLPCRYNG